MKIKSGFLLTILLFSGMSILGQKSKSDFDVKVRDVDEIKMVYYEFTGPYDQSFNEFGQLMGYLHQNNIPMGKHSLGLFYDDPEQVPAEKLRSKIGFMVKKKVDSNEKYKYMEIPAGKAVSVKYKSMDEIMGAYEAISKYIMEKELSTVDYSVEIYYSADPQVVDAEILFYISD